MPLPTSRFRRAVAAAVTFAVAALLFAGFSALAEAKSPANPRTAVAPAPKRAAPPPESKPRPRYHARKMLPVEHMGGY